MMKINVNVDCTPEEARSFFGLPNVEPVNNMIVEAMRQRTAESIDTLSDPKIFWENAMSQTGPGMEMMTKMMSAAMGTPDAGQNKKK